jgi:hypothetical protein
MNEKLTPRSVVPIPGNICFKAINSLLGMFKDACAPCTFVGGDEVLASLGSMVGRDAFRSFRRVL